MGMESDDTTNEEANDTVGEESNGNRMNEKVKDEEAIDVTASIGNE